MSNILRKRETPLFRLLAGMVLLFILGVKVASPFLHTHDNSSPNRIIVSIHCDACDYEATQAIEPEAAIALPSVLFYDRKKVYEIASPTVSEQISPSESRGPPQHS